MASGDPYMRRRQWGGVFAIVGFIGALLSVLTYVGADKTAGYDALPNLMWAIVGSGALVAGCTLLASCPPQWRAREPTEPPRVNEP